MVGQRFLVSAHDTFTLAPCHTAEHRMAFRLKRPGLKQLMTRRFYPATLPHVSQLPGAHDI
jgi:hypothetical protein